MELTGQERERLLALIEEARRDDASEPVLASLAAKLKAIPSLGAEIARAVAPDLLALNKASAAAGMTSDGKPWAPTKKGERALVRAADALSVTVVGDAIVLILSGINVFHNKTRPIIVDTAAGLPKAYGDAIQKTASAVLARAFS